MNEENRYTNDEQLKRRSNRQKQRMIRRGALGAICVVVLAVLILAVVLITKGCSSGSDALKGKWDLDGTTAYAFSGEGTVGGTYTLTRVENN